MDWDETLERVRSAARTCAAANLARLRIEDGGFRLEIRRTVTAQRPPPAALEAASSNGKTSNGAGGHDHPPRNLLRAEFVGVLRFARPMIAPGTLLSEDRELAYVESLGIRNPIRSGGPGKVAEIFVGDGQPVDFGQKLIALETA